MPAARSSSYVAHRASGVLTALVLAGGLLSGCGHDTPTADPSSPAPSPGPSSSTVTTPATGSSGSSGSSGPAAHDPSHEGGEVPGSAPATLAEAVRAIATAARGIVAPVPGRVVQTIDGTTCRLVAGKRPAGCRIGTGLRTKDYCLPPADTRVVAVTVRAGRASPRCGADADPPATASDGPRRLPNGQVTAGGVALRCLGLDAGVTCVDRQHRTGFFLSLDGYRVLN